MPLVRSSERAAIAVAEAVAAAATTTVRRAFNEL